MTSSEAFQLSDQSRLLDLCASLHSKDGVELQSRINAYLEDCTGASLSFLIPPESQAEATTSSPLDSLYVQVIGSCCRSSPPDQLRTSPTPPASTTSPVYFSDLSPSQVSFIESLINKPLDSFVAIPILRRDNAHNNTDGQAVPQRQQVLIACLANKANGEAFGNREVMLVQECFRVTLGILLNTLAYEEEKRLKSQCQSLLTVAKNLFTHLDDVTVLLRQIMSEARQLTQAERCSLFLLDRDSNELVAKVFDGDITEGNEKQNEVRLPTDEGIAGHVARTGEVLNIRNAQTHPMFYRNIDQLTGFTTRNILCFPIKDDSHVIGVAELCNKATGAHFTMFDEEIAGAFSAYCGISIVNGLMYKKVKDAQYRSKLSNELMMYHMKTNENKEEKEIENLENKVIDEDVHRLMASAATRYHLPENFAHFEFNPRTLSPDDSPIIVLQMFKELGFVEKFRIPLDTLSRFVLMVRRGYRTPPYHNWMHAFTVGHFCYLLMKNIRILENKYLSHMECFALFVACLCHDLDHRGTNNSFQVTSNSVLAALYSSEGSVMERHHFAQTICILNTEGCNIFDSLDKDEYVRCLDTLRDIILATDLAHHFRIRNSLKQMISDGYAPSNEHHRERLLSLLMTSCDLSDQSKDWENSKNIADQIYSEFFSQGDLEKAMGNNPQEMMDREKAYIPTLQTDFIDHVALPVFRDLATLFPQASSPFQSVQANRTRWGKAHEALLKRGRNGITGKVKELFRDDSVEREVAQAEINQ